MDKRTLRREIGEKKRALSGAEIERRSAALAAKLYETAQYRQAASLYAYLSYNQEVRTRPIIERAWADGKRVAVPKVFGDEMRFIWIDSFEQVAPRGPFGIEEPLADAPVADDARALVLMPGLAFDGAGHRVGYGGGYYDRYCAAHPGHPLVALCYDFQLFDRLETEAHDVPAHLVIADS